MEQKRELLSRLKKCSGHIYETENAVRLLDRRKDVLTDKYKESGQTDGQGQWPVGGEKGRNSATHYHLEIWFVFSELSTLFAIMKAGV